MTSGSRWHEAGSTGGRSGRLTSGSRWREAGSTRVGSVRFGGSGTNPARFDGVSRDADAGVVDQLLVQEAGNSIADELGICWLIVILVNRRHPNGEEPFVPRRHVLETGGEEFGS